MRHSVLQTILPDKTRLYVADSDFLAYVAELVFYVSVSANARAVILGPLRTSIVLVR